MLRWAWAAAVMISMAFPAMAAKAPVIFTSDIGDDIDDTWALAALLRSPELDLKLVVGDYGNAIYRAKLFAKFLTVAGRTDVAVGIGVGDRAERKANQSRWVEGYDLKSYAGKVHDDGVQAMIDLVMASEAPVTIISVGPTPNMAELLRRKPEVAGKARFVGMYGSVRKGYDGRPRVDAEWNVKQHVAGARAALSAPWTEAIITPLDTCGLVRLKGDKYAKVRDSQDPIARAVIENYRVWLGTDPNRAREAETQSSILFDTVAVYLAITQELTKVEELPIRVTDDGKTVIDEQQGKKIHVATEWKDLGKFEDWFVERVAGN